jgi:acyl carrier protein
MALERINSATLDSQHGSAGTLGGPVNIIYAAIAELNPQLAKEQQLQASLDTTLFGDGGKLDSLGLANLIVITEQKLEDHYGFRVDLMQNDPFSPGTGHFRTIRSLATHISDLLSTVR